MKLFPHVLVRVGGGSFEELEKLNLDGTLNTIFEIQALKKRRSFLKNKISEVLYNVIPSKNDSKIQNLLLNFKRDIFNDKNITGERIETIKAHLPEPSIKNLEEYFQISVKIKTLIQKGEQGYTEEMVDVRQNLRKLVMNDNLQKGLILSSQSLLKRTKNYLNQDKQSLKKEDIKTEQSLMKYITRMYAKTSPFSTFTNLMMAKAADVNNSSMGNKSVLYVEDNSKPEVISHVRLNNYLLKYLWGLLLKNTQIVQLLLLRPNPSIKDNDDHYLFLVNSNNVESFQRIPSNPVLKVFHLLPSQKKEGIVYKDLVDTIIDKEYIDASREEIEAYLNQLIEFGFLEYNLGVSGIDPDWDLKLRKILIPIGKDYPLIEELNRTLREVRNLAMKYGKARIEARKQILEDAYEKIQSVCMKLHEAAGLPEDERKTPEVLRKEKENEKKQVNNKTEAKKKQEEKENEDNEDIVFKRQTSTRFNFKPENIFYEDTTLNLEPVVDQDELFTLVFSLNRLIQGMCSFEGRQDERNKMVHYFKQKYKDASSVDLLTMYEDFYRDVKKPEAERQEKRKKERLQSLDKVQENAVKKGKDKKNDLSKEKEEPAPFVVPRNKERMELNKAWLNKFKEIIIEAVDVENASICFGYDQIQKVNEIVSSDGQNNTHYKSSYGCFIQFFHDEMNNKFMGVLKGTLPGFGKMFSRFLHVFNDSVTTDLRKWNISIDPNSILAEDCDASYFNANLHPPLMPFEIWIPNGHNMQQAEKQVPVTKLEIHLDEGHHRLSLKHKSLHKEVFVFDLGFQGQQGRSPLYQLLENFTLAKYLSTNPLKNMLNDIQDSDKDQERDKKKIKILPRIVYEESIILQRKAWLVPKPILPYKKQNESDMSYFLRVNEWRMKYDMPDDIFLFVNTDRTLENTAPEAAKKLGRDDYKPQYISFKNPLLINLFEKLLYKVPKTLKIEEMLPNSQQLVNLHNKRYVTEFVIQWYDDVEEK